MKCDNSRVQDWRVEVLSDGNFRIRHDFFNFCFNAHSIQVWNMPAQFTVNASGCDNHVDQIWSLKKTDNGKIFIKNTSYNKCVNYSPTKKTHEYTSLKKCNDSIEQIWELI